MLLPLLGIPTIPVAASVFMILCILDSAAETERFVFRECNLECGSSGQEKKFFLRPDYVINNRHAIPFRELKVHWVMLMFF